MSPPSQGYESTRMVPECYWLPKPVNTQALTGFPTPTTIQVPNSLLPSLHNPREWTLSLLCHAVPQDVLLLPGLQCSWSRISMLGLSGLTAVRKVGHRPKHLRHAGLKSWLDYTNNLYNQQYHGFSSTVCLPFPSQDMNEER
jgi:hypothetical protein